VLLRGEGLSRSQRLVPRGPVPSWSSEDPSLTDHLSQERRSWNMSRIRERTQNPSWKYVPSFIAQATVPTATPLRFPVDRTSSCRCTRPSYWSMAASGTATRTAVRGICRSRGSISGDENSADSLRDRRTAAVLRGLGWRVAVVWECEVRRSNLWLRRLPAVQRRTQK